jgi:hypothetical protein
LNLLSLTHSLPDLVLCCEKTTEKASFRFLR